MRQLELWAVATHSQIGRIQERSEALEPVVEKLSDAADQAAAIAVAVEAANEKRTAKITTYLGWVVGVVGIVAVAWDHFMR